MRVEVLARKDCANRGMAMVVVERAIEASGVPVELDVIDVTSEAQATKRKFLGSPTVRVDGLDVELDANGRTDFSLDDRVYRGRRGLQGWPDETWIRGALLVASVQASNGDGSSEGSSATSP